MVCAAACVRYLKLSVVVLGPGDRPYVHDPSEDAKQAADEKTKGIASMLLMPPTIKQTTNFLVATIHRCANALVSSVACPSLCVLRPALIHRPGALSRATSAEHLPAIDKPKFHVTSGGIDAFVSVLFAGTQCHAQRRDARVRHGL